MDPHVPINQLRYILTQRVYPHRFPIHIILKQILYVIGINPEILKYVYLKEDGKQSYYHPITATL